MNASYVQRGEYIDVVPENDVKAGDIVVRGRLVGVSKLDIKAGTLGALATTGVYDVAKGETAFAAGDKVDITGTSKGHGTAGSIKRWNFSRLKESHGTGPVARHAGSLGACSDPSRVYKGKKLAGRQDIHPIGRDQSCSFAD